jgi:hypothetical protein
VEAWRNPGYSTLNADCSEGAAEDPRRRSLSSSSHIARPLLLCVRRILSLLQRYMLFTANTQGSAKPPPWVPVGFEGGFGPKGLGNSAQALAWVALFLRASPVRAPDNAGAIPYRPHRNSDDYLLRPFRAGRVYCNRTQAKAWAKFPRPFGPKRAPKSDRLLLDETPKRHSDGAHWPPPAPL